MADSTSTIIVTRPEPFADELATSLAKHSFKVEKHPLIKFVANPEFSENSDFAASHNADYLIFVSQQAVHYYLNSLSSESRSTLKEKTLLAVGKATQESLQEFELSALAPQRFDSEGILELIEQLNPENHELNILLVCGNQGRPLLEDSLSEKYQVKRLEVYQRIGIAQAFPKITVPDNTAVVVTSEQLLKLSLHQLSLQELPKVHTSDNSLRKKVAFICASSRIEEIAKQLGVANCYTANSAANQDLVNACLKWQSFVPNKPDLLTQSEAMSESDQHENEIIEALELDQERESSEPKKNKAGILKPLFWLLILAGLGYGGFWMWQQGYFQTSSSTQDKNQNSELTRLVNLEKQLKTQNDQIRQLVTEQNSQSSTQSSNQQELQRQIESLQQQLVASQRKFQTLSADAASQARDWQIAEAEYLIRQAAQKIHYSDDTASVVALLEAADQQILASGDSNLLSLRRAISQDIAQIKSTVAIDIDGILVKLDTIESQIPSLSLASVKFDENNQEQPEVIEPVESSTAWQTFKTNVKDTFSDYYKVHHYDQSVKPFINPKQSDLLQQNLLMTIKMAQLSALRHQQTGYDKSVDEIAKWIKEFYQTNNQSQQILEQLSLLASAKVSVQLPNKLTSLDLIKQNNQERLNQWLQSSTIKSDYPEETDENGQSGNIEKAIQDTLERLDNTTGDNDSEEPTENDTESDSDGDQE